MDFSLWWCFKIRADPFGSNSLLEFEGVRKSKQTNKHKTPVGSMAAAEWDYTHLFISFSTLGHCWKGEINVPESQNLYMEESGVFLSSRHFVGIHSRLPDFFFFFTIPLPLTDFT